MLRFRRPAIACLVLLTFWPMLVFGQGNRVGIVTALEGNVTVARAAVPQPIPLKFKDDVFLQDRVATGDRSLARVLLGGKAVVTIRERSVLTITELPGKSTIELQAGKIGLAVAREKMRAGESIDITTANAVAAVRGTVVVAEVLQASAQVGRAAPVVSTSFYVLQGTITAVNVDPGTRTPMSTPLAILAGQSFRVIGGALPVVVPNPPVNVLTSGLASRLPQHPKAANQEQVTAQAVQTAVALVQALLGPAPSETTRPQTQGPQQPQGQQQGQDQQLTDSSSNAAGGQTTQGTLVQAPSFQCCALVYNALTNNAALLVGREAQQAPVPTLPGLGAGIAFPGFSGSVNQAASAGTSSDPSVVLVGQTFNLPGFFFNFSALDGSTVQLTQPLLSTVDSTFTGSSLMNVTTPVTSTADAPLIQLDPTRVTVSGDLFRVSSVLTLTHPLFTDTGGILTVSSGDVGVAQPVAVGTAPRGVAVNTLDGVHAYVTNPGSNSVSVITLGATPSASLVTDPGNEPGLNFVTPLGIAVAAAFGRGFVTSTGSVVTGGNQTTVTSGKIVVFDTATNQAIGLVNQFDGVHPVALGAMSDGTKVFVVNGGANPNTESACGNLAACQPTVSVVDVKGSKVDGAPILLAQGANPVAVVAGKTTASATVGGANDTAVYVADQALNTITVINVTTRTDANTTSTLAASVVATVQLGNGASPSALAVSPRGDRVYVLNQGAKTISVIATAFNTLLTPIVLPEALVPATSTPVDIAVAPDGTRLFVTTRDSTQTSNHVLVVDPTTRLVVAQFTLTGSEAGGIAVAPDGSHVYVANTGANEFESVSLSAGGSLLEIEAGGRLASTATGALITLSGSRITTDKALIKITGPAPSNAASLWIAGTLLDATNAAITVHDDALVSITGGAVVTQTGSAPVISINGGTLSLTGAKTIVDVVNGPGSAFALDAGGPLLSAKNTTLDLGRLLSLDASRARIGGGIALDAAHATFKTLARLSNGSALELTGPLASVTGGAILDVTHLVTIANPLNGGASLSIRGTLLDAQNAAITVHDDALVSITGGAVVTQTGSAPVVSIDGGTLGLTGARTIVDVVNGPGSALALDAGGPLFSARNITLDLGRLLSLDASRARIGGGITLGGGAHATFDTLARLSNGSALELTGPLASVTGGAILDVTHGLVTFAGTGANHATFTSGVTPTVTFEAPLGSDASFTLPMSVTSSGAIHLGVPGRTLDAVIAGAGLGDIAGTGSLLSASGAGSLINVAPGAADDELVLTAVGTQIRVQGPLNSLNHIDQLFPLGQVIFVEDGFFVFPGFSIPLFAPPAGETTVPPGTSLLTVRTDPLRAGTISTNPAAPFITAFGPLVDVTGGDPLHGIVAPTVEVPTGSTLKAPDVGGPALFDIEVGNSVTSQRALLTVRPGGAIDVARPLLGFSGACAHPCTTRVNVGSVLELLGAQANFSDPNVAVITIPAGVELNQTKSSGDLFLVDGTSRLTTAGTLLSISGTATLAGGVVNIRPGGSLTSTTAAPLLSSASATVTTTGDLFRVGVGATMTLRGALLSDFGGSTYAVGGNLLTAAGIVTSEGTSALLGFGDGTVSTRSLLVVTGTLTSTTGFALVESGSSTVAITTTGDVIEVRAGGAVTLTGPLLSRGTTYTVGGSLVNVAGMVGHTGSRALIGVIATTVEAESLLRVTGTLTSTTDSGSLLETTLSTIRTRGDLLHVGATGTLTVTEALLNAFSTEFTVGGNFLTVAGELTSTGPDVRSLQLVGGPVQVTGDLVHVSSSGRLSVLGRLVDQEGILTVGGDLLSVAGTLTSAGGEPVLVLRSPVSARSLLTVTGTVASTTTAALIASGSAATTGDLLQVAAGGQVSLAGPLLVAGGVLAAGGNVLTVAGTVRIDGTSALLAFGDGPVNAPSLLVVAGTGAVTSTTGQALIDSGSSAVAITTTGDAIEVRAGGRVTVAGGLLNRGLTYTAGGSLVNVAGTVEHGGTLIGVLGATVDAESVLRVTGSTTGAALLEASLATIRTRGDLLQVGPTGRVTVTEGLMTAFEASFTAGGNFLTVEGELTSTASGALLQLGTVALQGTGGLVHVTGGGRLALRGRLVDYSGALSLGGDVLAVAGTLTIEGEDAGLILRSPVSARSLLTVTGTVTSTTPAPLIFSGTVTTTGDLLQVASGGRLSLIGSLLSGDGVNTVGGNVLTVAGTVTSEGTEPLLRLGGTVSAQSLLVVTGTLTSTTGTELINAGASAITTTGGVIEVRAGGTVTVTGSLLLAGATYTVGGSVVNIAGTVGLAGTHALVEMNGVTVVDAESLLRVTGTLTSTTVAGLLETSVSAITTRGDLFHVSATGHLTLADALVNSFGTAFTVGGNFLTVAGSLTSTGPDVRLIQLGSGAVQVTGDLVQVSSTGRLALLGRLLDQAGSLTVGGDVLAVAGTLTTAGTQPLLVMQGGTVSARSLVTVTGTVTSTTTAPLVGTGLATLTTSGDVLRVATGTTLTLAGGALGDFGSTYTVGGNFLTVAGVLTGAGPATLLDLGETPNAQVHVTGDLVQVSSGGRLALVGPLLVQEGTLTVGGDVLAVAGTLTIGGTDGVAFMRGPAVSARSLLTVTGTLTSTTPGVLIGTGALTVTTTGDLLRVVAGATLTLGGTGLTDFGNATTFTVGGNGLTVNGVLTSGADALLVFGGGAVQVVGDLVQVGSGGRLALNGRLLLQGGSLTVGGDVLAVAGTLTSEGADPGVAAVGGTVSGRSLLTVTGTLTSTTPAPLIGTFGATVTTTGDLLRVAAGATLTLGGTGLTDFGSASAYTVGGNGLTVEGVLTSGADALLVFGGGSAAQVTGDLVQVGSGGRLALKGRLLIQGGSLTVGGDVLAVAGTVTSEGADFGAAVVTGTVSARSLLTVTGTVTSTTTTAPLLFGNGATITTTGDVVRVGATGSVTLAERLLFDFESAYTVGGNFLTVEGTLTSQGLGFDRSGVQVAGDLVQVRSGGTLAAIERLLIDDGSLTVGGDVVAVAGTLTSTGTNAAVVVRGTVNARSLLTVTGTVTSTTTAPLISGSGATITTTGDVLHVGASGSVTLAERLLSDFESAYTAGANFLTVDGTLTSTTGAALIGAPSTITATGDLIQVGSGGTGARVQLAGPLFSATASNTVSAGGHFLSVTNGGQVSSSSSDPLAVFGGITLTLGTGPAGAGALVLVNACTAAPCTGATDGLGVRTGASVSVSGPLFSAADSTLSAPSRLVQAQGDGLSPIDGVTIVPAIATASSSTPYPLVSLLGGHVTVGTPTSTDAAMLLASGFTTQSFLVDATLLPAVGNQEPLRHNGGDAFIAIDSSPTDGTAALVEVKGNGSDTGGNAVRVDTALLQATAPILSLIHTDMTTASHVVNLFQKARVESNTDLVRMDRSTLTVVNGHLVNVAGGSLLRADGLLTVANAGGGPSTVTISNGMLLNVTGNSFVVLNRLISFNGSDNLVSASNNIASTGTLFGLIPIAGTVQVGGSASLASVFPGLTTFNGGAVNALPGNNRLNVTGTGGAGTGVLINVAAGSTLKLGQ